ncbi:MAG: UDP-4-amino-4,6-dideoxy-N-acetyl-beta-L-altrosamine N-acetyltransferase [Janthinobacterium lividum]
MQFLPLLDADADVQARVRQLRNQPDVRRYMYTSHEIGEVEHQAWLDSLRGNARQSVFVVMLDEQPIGIVSLNAISATQKTADWAFYLDPQVQGKGFGSLVEFWLLDHAFDDAGLEKLNCEVLHSNTAVIGMHEKFGFVREGVRRQNILKDGKRLDVVMLGITRDEWQARRPSLEPLIHRLQGKRSA